MITVPMPLRKTFSEDAKAVTAIGYLVTARGGQSFIQSMEGFMLLTNEYRERGIEYVVFWKDKVEEEVA
jgi:hypothetical protein